VNKGFIYEDAVYKGNKRKKKKYPKKYYLILAV